MAEPGSYPELAAFCRTHVQASGVVLIIIDGNRGTSVTIEADALVGLSLPEILRTLADDVEAKNRRA